MITTNVTDAKRDLSALLARVAGGETVLVLRRGRPLARIVPAGDGDLGTQDRLTVLEKAGVLRRGSLPPDAGVLDDNAPSLPPESSLLAALLEERRRGR